VRSAAATAPHVLLLTGTPSLSKPFDLWTQVDIVAPGLLGRSRSGFGFSYCNKRLVPVPMLPGKLRYGSLLS
jgi:hypothetical protein